jgi:hypothetical protein
MIQSSEYVLSPEFISSYKKIDASEAEVVWDLVHDPSSATIESIRCVLFNQLSYNKSARLRYFTPQIPIPINLDAPSPKRNRMTVNEMITTIREANITPSKPAQFPIGEDYIPLHSDSEEDTDHYTHRDGDTKVNGVCPAHVEEALFIVSNFKKDAAFHYNVHHSELKPRRDKVSIKKSYNNCSAIDSNGFTICSSSTS